MNRNSTIDGLRGVAIVLMFGANMWPYFFPDQTPPLPLRILFSSVAPLFLCLSGYTAGIFRQDSVARLRLFARASKILLMAVFIDVLVWQIIPFHTFDVLYIIAIGQLFFAAQAYVGRMLLWFTLIVSISLYLIPHAYNFELYEVQLSSFQLTSIEPLHMLHSLVWDGWFPLSPWLAWMTASYLIAKTAYRTVSQIALITTGLSLVVFYIVSISGNLSLINPLRNGYAELFYPVTLYFVVFMIGVACLALAVIWGKYALPASTVSMGRYSLFAYLFHCIVIKLAIIPNTSVTQLHPTVMYLFVWLALVVATPILAKWMKSTLDKSSCNKVRRPILVLLGLS